MEAITNTFHRHIGPYLDRYSAPGTTALATIGLGTVGIFAYQLSSFAWTHLRPSSLPKYQHGKPGSTWALVTGASDGIGFGFAEVLLQRGFNVLMHGRNEKKLQGRRQTLQDRFPSLQIRIVVADAGAADVDFAGVEASVRALPGKLTILINNVGGVPYGPAFATLDARDEKITDALLNINARFPMQLTRTLIPILEQNGPSLIINIGSIVGQMGVPYLATYSASKGFNLRFSESIRGEFIAEKKDIEVIGILVGAVLTSTNTVGVGDIFTCNALTCANATLDKVGCGKSLVWGWWRHSVQWLFTSSLPQSFMESQIIRISKERKIAADAEEAQKKKA